MAKKRQLSHKPGAERAPYRPDVIEKITVNASTADATAVGLLDALYAAMPHRKRLTVKDFLKHGQVMVDGNVTTRFDQPVTAASDIQVNISRQWQTFSNPRLKIVYEDDDIIVVNKGYGLLSVGNDRVKEGTAYSLLRDYLKRRDQRNMLFIVHRLDQHTSGLMMFAKSEEAKLNMQHNWNNMVIDRRYAAIVEGVPEKKEGTIRSYLAENTRMTVYSTDNPEEGKLAVTRWKLVKSRNGYSLLDISLDTGRKNQIRVHMHDMGHPIAGDRKYGARTSPAHRVALHARTLRFVHPITRADMRFEAPLPASFTRLV
ncbi:MAG: RluA family pseudouridine synthase [Bacteroidales bacterium]|nr:RluA family pseudouridine synthase [Bacteroidales bacterium]